MVTKLTYNIQMQNIYQKKNNLFRKFIGALLLFTIGAVSASNGSNHSTDGTKSLQALIRQIKTAPVSQKRVLINQLKLKLRTMQQHKREQIILDLRRTFSTHQEHTPITHMHSNKHSKEAVVQPMIHSITAIQQLKQIHESKQQYDHNNKAPNYPKNMPSTHPEKQYTPNRGTEARPNRNLPDTNNQNGGHNGIGSGNSGIGGNNSGSGHDNGSMGGNQGRNSSNSGMNENMGGGNNSGGSHGYGSKDNGNQGRGGR